MIKTAPIDRIASAEEFPVRSYRRYHRSRRRPLHACWLLFVAVTLLAVPTVTSAQAEAQKQDVLATGPIAGGGSDAIYLARTTALPGVNGAAGVQTQIYRRTADRKYLPWGKPIPRRVLSMTPVGDQLAVLTDDGNWLLQSSDGVNLGSPLDVRDAKLVVLASDRNGLYAVARILGGVGRLSPATMAAPTSLPAIAPLGIPATTLPVLSSTKPATQTVATSTTLPTTGPAISGPATSGPATAVSTTRPLANAPEMLAIVEYSPSGWRPVVDVPPNVARPVDSVSLVLLDDWKFLLVREAPEQIRLWRLDGRRWNEIGQARIPANTNVVQLVAGAPKPTVWLSPSVQSEPDHILVFDKAGLGATRAATRPSSQSTTTPATQVAAAGLANDVSLAGTAGIAPNVRSIAYAYNHVRSLTFVGDMLSEQSYDPTTIAPVEEPRKFNLEAPGYPYSLYATYFLLAAAMGFAIVASLRRRSELISLEIDADSLPLAPLQRRLAAGLIDALPYLIAVVYAVNNLNTDGEMFEQFEFDIIRGVGFVVYLAVTMTTELIAGRSVGKMICRLRVISVTGAPATKGQIATRNILRIIDVALSFIPLLLIPFSPLRQRAGDAAAGTIVVVDEVKEEVTDVEPAA